MTDNEYLAVDHIEGLIYSIESHWRFLQGDYPKWPEIPAFVFVGGEMRTSHEHNQGDDLLRRRLLTDPNHLCPAFRVIDTLWAVANEEYRDESPREHLRISSAWTAHALAQKSMKMALSKAELNELGWMLTQLVALDTKPIKAALLSLQVNGGVKSGESRRAENADRDKAICAQGNRLKSEGHAERDIAGIIVSNNQWGLKTTKRVREILRAGGVLQPATKKGK